MKKRAIAILICFVLLISFLPINEKAYADPGLISQMAALTFAYANSIGFNITMQGANSIFAQNWTESLINDYSSSSGKSITEIFGSEALRIEAGKIAAGQRAINGVIEFLDWIQSTYNVDNVKSLLGYDDVIRPASESMTSGTEWVYGAYAYNETVPTSDPRYVNNYMNAYGYTGDSRRAYAGSSNSIGSFLRIDAVVNNTTVTFHFRYSIDYNYHYITVSCAPHTVSIYDQLSESYVKPTILNPNQHWVGDYGGAADTNLDQMVGDVFQDVADTNLSVEGEVIDGPAPTPAPTMAPGIPDIIGGLDDIGQTTDNIDTNLGDVLDQLESQQQALDGIEGAIEGVQQGINTQTGALSGAIDQAAQDVADAIGEQTQALDQTLTQTAEGIQDIAEALQPGEIQPKKFDLRRLFPFCIPFDIHNLLQKFNAQPVAPHVQLPFVIQSIGFSYMIDLDFSVFDSVAAALRTVEFIVFAIGLAWATSKVIKW